LRVCFFGAYFIVVLPRTTFTTTCATHVLIFVFTSTLSSTFYRGETKEYVLPFDPRLNGNVRITMVFNDPASMAPTKTMMLNDLDLTLDVAGRRFHPNGALRADMLNNVEHIFLKSVLQGGALVPGSGYKIKVTATRVLSKLTFSLVMAEGAAAPADVVCPSGVCGSHLTHLVTRTDASGDDGALPPFASSACQEQQTCDTCAAQTGCGWCNNIGNVGCKANDPKLISQDCSHVGDVFTTTASSCPLQHTAASPCLTKPPGAACNDGNADTCDDMCLSGRRLQSCSCNATSSYVAFRSFACRLFTRYAQRSYNQFNSCPHVTADGTCAGRVCAATCAGYSCPTNTNLKATAASISCPGGECNNTVCCEGAATCAAFACTDGQER
jgi:hypothetical protein